LNFCQEKKKNILERMIFMNYDDQSIKLTKITDEEAGRVVGGTAVFLRKYKCPVCKYEATIDITPWSCIYPITACRHCLKSEFKQVVRMKQVKE
jgi:hypothetical protein